jgi:hypothetical protein
MRQGTPVATPPKDDGVGDDLSPDRPPSTWPGPFVDALVGGAGGPGLAAAARRWRGAWREFAGLEEVDEAVFREEAAAHEELNRMIGELDAGEYKQLCMAAEAWNAERDRQLEALHALTRLLRGES